MTSLEGSIRTEPQDRLYEALRNLLTLTACVGISAVAFMSGNSDPASLTGIGIIHSKQFNLHIHVPNAGVLECAIKDVEPNLIGLEFVPVTPVSLDDVPQVALLRETLQHGWRYRVRQLSMKLTRNG